MNWKLYNRVLLICLLVYSASLCTWFGKEQSLTEKYQVPPESKQILDKHLDEIEDFFKKNYFAKKHIFPFLPTYVVKIRCVQGRLEGREHCEKMIKKYPRLLGHMAVPKKYCYVVDHERLLRPDYSRLGDELLIAKVVKGAVEYHERKSIKEEQKLSLQQTEWFADFVMKTGWRDARRDNVGVDGDTLYALDTEEGFFVINGDKISRRKAGLSALQKLVDVPFDRNTFTTEAQVYLEKRVKLEKEYLEINHWIKVELEKDRKERERFAMTVALKQMDVFS